MNNLDSIVALVEEYFRKYDNFGVIEEDDLYRSAILAIKTLGNNATLVYEDVVKVKNGIAKLPANFYRLQEVRTCEPIAYNRNNRKVELHTVMNTEFYNLIHELKTSWNECEDCCKEKDMRVYRKEVVMKEDLSVTCHYNKGHRVRLTKPTIKNYCDKMYGDMSAECDMEISITRDKINANFNEGDLYIKYKGFPLDEKGNFDFEETPNNFMESYIEYTLKTDMCERLIAMGVQGLSNMLPYFDQKRKYNKHKVETELKFNSLDPVRMINKVVADNQSNYNKYTLGRG